MSAHFYPVTLIKKERVAQDTWAFYFDREATQFPFAAGQYINVILDDALPGETNSRMFSLASAPHEHLLMIVTKPGQSNFKEQLFSLPLGSQLKIFGPMGGFVICSSDTKPYVLLSGGVGITPFRSMLCDLSQKSIDMPIMLVASFSSAEDVIFYNELNHLAETQKNLSLQYTISRSVGPEGVQRISQGRITKDMILSLIPDIHKPIYMVAGFPEMVSSLEDMLLSMGVPSEHIRLDTFTGY